MVDLVVFIESFGYKSIIAIGFCLLVSISVPCIWRYTPLHTGSYSVFIREIVGKSYFYISIFIVVITIFISSNAPLVRGGKGLQVFGAVVVISEVMISINIGENIGVASAVVHTYPIVII